MASLDGFFNSKEGKLVDLSWLEVSQQDYDNLPFDATPSYISIPKLEEAWMHLEDSNTKLVPNIDLNFNAPQQPYPGNDALQSIPSLIEFTKKQMMAGKSGQDLVEAIKQKATPNLIKAAYAELQKLSKEQGLLGSVYIDPTTFSKCNDGAEFVAKRAKTARYVKAMSKCSGCFYNKQSRCEQYKKVIASEIPYGEDLFNFYSKHFSSVAGKNVLVTSKADLQKQFLAKEIQTTRVAEFKPTSSEVEKEKTLKDKEKEYKQHFEGLTEELSSISKEATTHDVALLLLKGYSSKVIRDYIKTKYSYDEFNSHRAIFDSVLSKQGSLGKVYFEINKVLPSEIRNASEIQSFITKYASRIPYVVLENNHPLHNTIFWVCSQLKKTVVASLSEIPKLAWESAFNEYPPAIKNKLAAIFEENPVKGLRLAFIQSDLAKNVLPLTENKDVYNLRSALDTTEYNPSNKTNVFFTTNKIAHALDRGYTLSSIVKTGRSLGLSDLNIASNIYKTLQQRESINKYQLDIHVKLPENVKVAVSQKDINQEMSQKKALANFDCQSASAPVDNMIADFGLKEAALSTSDVKSHKNDLEILELNQFNIG